MMNTERSRSGGWWLVLATSWAALFSYLLLTSDPTVGALRLRTLEDVGHLLGSAVLGFLVFRVMTRRTDQWQRAFLLSCALTLAFLVGLEFAQYLRPGRGFETADIKMTFFGTVLGVALAASTVLINMVARRPQRHGSEGGNK